MADPVSMKDVAAAAQVSVSTVSLALAGDVRVSAPTRARVQACAVRLGYTPNPLVSTLAASRFRSVGKPVPIAALLRRSCYLPALRRTASTYGYALHDMRAIDPGGFGQRCAELGAGGVILSVRGPVVAPAGLPVVRWLHEGMLAAGEHAVELNDWSMLVLRTIDRLREAGWRRIGVVLTPAEPVHWADEVRRGAALASGCPLLLWRSRKTAELLAWITAERLDALAMQHSLPWTRLRTVGVVMPTAVCSLSDGQEGHLAGFMPDHAVRDRVTIELIDAVRRHGPRPSIRILIPAEWRPGRSLGGR